MDNLTVLDHWRAFQGCVERPRWAEAQQAFLRFAACGPHPAAFWELLAFVRPGAHIDDLYWSTVSLRAELGRPLGAPHFRALFFWAARCCRDTMTHEDAHRQVALARLVGAVKDTLDLAILRDFLTILDEDLCDQAEVALLREFSLFAEDLVESLDSALQLEEPWSASQRLHVLRDRLHREFAVLGRRGARVVHRLWTECMLPMIELRLEEALLQERREERRRAQLGYYQDERRPGLWIRRDVDRAAILEILEQVEQLERVRYDELDPFDPELIEAMHHSLHAQGVVPAHLLANQLAPAA